MSLFGALKRAFGGAKIDLVDRFEFDSKKWQLGNNGKFNSAKDKTTSQEFLLKLIDAGKTKKYRDKFPGKGFATEVEISGKFDHENILQAVESGVTKSGDQFILYDENGWSTLEELIKQRSKEVRQNAYSLIRQLAVALIEIHKEGFVHRDVCPRNILVDKQAQNLKLFDFGFTVPNEKEYSTVKNRTGTPLYMAPEIVRMKETDQRVDIFAFGITVFQLLSYRHPWGVEENSSKSTLQFDARPAEDIRNYLPRFKEPKAEALAKCLAIKPDARFSNLKQFLIKSGIK